MSGRTRFIVSDSCYASGACCGSTLRPSTTPLAGRRLLKEAVREVAGTASVLRHHLVYVSECDAAMQILGERNCLISCSRIGATPPVRMGCRWRDFVASRCKFACAGSARTSSARLRQLRQRTRKSPARLAARRLVFHIAVAAIDGRDGAGAVGDLGARNNETDCISLAVARAKAKTATAGSHCLTASTSRPAHAAAVGHV